ncbi:hypothetical protein VN97_g9485, partial [Penicillium thymicola]
PPLGRL